MLSVCLTPPRLSHHSLLPRFQLRDVYHHSQSRPAAPLATLTRAQVGKQLIQDQRRVLQAGSQEQILSSVGQKVAAQENVKILELYVCGFFFFFLLQ